MKLSSVILLACCLSAPARDTLTTVAMTIWGEGANQSYNGKYAVASTIWNRANGKATNMKSVCLARKQFSCWRKRVFTQPLPDLKKPLDRVAWRDCVALASLMVSGKFRPDNAARHYHRYDIAPKWSRNMMMIASVDDHVFYK